MNRLKERKQPSLLGKVTGSSNFGIFIALVLMVVVFTVMKNSYFSKNNIMNILVSCSVVGLVAIGETYLMIAGQIDMSCGSVSAFSGVLVALLLQDGWGMVPAILVTLLVGVVIGLVNAFLVTKMEISFFIATLATQSIFRGLAFIIGGGKSIGVSNQAFLKIGTTRILGIYLPIIIFLVFFLVFALILAKTRFGRSIYMVGGNMTGAFIGLLIMQGFNNGLSVLGVQSFWQEVAKGLLLIVALAFDLLRRKQREREMLRKMEESNR